MCGPNQRQMYIITADCYIWDGEIKVAVIKYRQRNGFYGPAFTAEEKNITEANSVIIKQQHSFTREESYDAITCPHCNAFIRTTFFTHRIHYSGRMWGLRIKNS